MSRLLPPLNALRAFDAVARCGSFTEAAEQLFVTQSAVSHQIHNLEKRLKVTLFERKAGKTRLTLAGQRLYPSVRAAFDQIETSTRHLDVPRAMQSLHVHSPPTFAQCWLIPRMRLFRKRYPDIDITIMVQGDDNLAADTRHDAAIRFGNGQWQDADIHFLMQEIHIAVCAPQLLSNGGKIDLSKQTLIHVAQNKEERFPTWHHWLDAAEIHDIDTRGGLEFDVLTLAIQAATAGMGVTIADKHMVERELANGDLVQPLNVQTPGHQSYWLATRSSQPMSSRLVIFRDWLTSELSAV